MSMWILDSRAMVWTYHSVKHLKVGVSNKHIISLINKD